MSTIPFFTKQDILDLKENRGEKYDKKNSNHVRIGRNLSKGVCEKTKHWCSQVKIILSDDYECKCRRSWLNQAQKFEHYTWGQLYKKGHKDSGVFFTVGAESGINGRGYEIICKLDYKHVGEMLKEEQKKICNQLIKNHVTKVEWVVNIDDLQNWTWDKLIEETVDFINKYTHLYDEVIEKIGPSSK